LSVTFSAAFWVGLKSADSPTSRPARFQPRRTAFATSTRLNVVAMRPSLLKVGTLMYPRKLGVRRDQAVTHGMSSKGAWVMSSSQAVHEALSIAYLTQTGLASLLTIWRKLTARK
jgi:hypothetical protein